jgi:hypothetical protein
MLNLFIIYCFNLLYSAFIYCILHLFIAYRIYLLHAAFIYCMFFYFSYCVVCPSSIYGFWIPLWYLQTLLTFTLFHLEYTKINAKDKQRSTHQIRDGETRTALKSWGELRCSRGVSSLFSTDGTRSVTLITNPVISYEWRKDSNVIKTSDQW